MTQADISLQWSTAASIFCGKPSSSLQWNPTGG
jgi:hypothetical protein